MQRLQKKWSDNFTDFRPQIDKGDFYRFNIEVHTINIKILLKFDTGYTLKLS